MTYNKNIFEQRGELLGLDKNIGWIHRWLLVSLGFVVGSLIYDFLDLSFGMRLLVFTVAGTGLTGFVLFYLLTENLPFGTPDKDMISEYRWNQFKGYLTGLVFFYLGGGVLVSFLNISSVFSS